MANAQNQTSDFNLDALLDGNLDDLADMPEFKPYPAGTHRILGTIVDKATNKKDWVNGHPAFILEMKAVETIELASADKDVGLEKDAATNIMYMMDNEMGQGQFKKVLAAASAKFGIKSNRELISEFKNIECLVVTKQRANKDKTQVYTDIVEIMVE